MVHLRILQQVQDGAAGLQLLPGFQRVVQIQLLWQACAELARLVSMPAFSLRLM